MTGYIKMNRKILDWEWYKDINTKTIFIHCLLKANWKESTFQGEKIPRGSFATSVATLSVETGLTQRQTRTALQHLQMTNELTIKTTTRFSVVTVNNYELYQESDKPNDKQTTNEHEETRHSGDNNRRNKEYNNNINVQSEANEMFLRVWSKYPFRKNGKSAIRDATKKRLYTEVGEEQLLRCIDRFKQDMSGRDPRYVVIGSTFFNTTYADYLDTTYKETMGIIDETPFESNDKQVKRELQ